MCGICGFIGEVINQTKVIQDMTDLILHRGPDDVGYFIDNDIAMGFRRLSIIDVDGGKQPIYNETNNLVITFNGEIYNFKELRSKLILKSHTFYTDTDTEVVIHGFEEWGEGVVEKLRGMFAFAIWDRSQRSLFLARDPFGIKPLYYGNFGETFLYASEIKSFFAHPNFEKKFDYKMLDHYLSFQYAPPPETFFENVRHIMPGHFAWFKDGKLTEKRYFDASFAPDENLSIEKAKAKIQEAFENSVEAHKIADVPVGCFLSGGVDSSYVASYFSGQKAFSVGFDFGKFGKHYDETEYSQNLANELGIEFHKKTVTAEEFWDAVRYVQYMMDQPLADPACIPLYFVSKIASEHVKVVLSGEGADELFGGYPVYNEPRVFRLYHKIFSQKVRTFLAKIVKKVPFKFKGQGFITRGEHPIESKFIGNAKIFDVDEKRKILKNSEMATDSVSLCKKYYRKFKGYDKVTKMQCLDINLWMVGDILLKADRMSMVNSLELRVPFLDKEVFKVARVLPTRLKVPKENTKFALRCAASEHLPKETAERPKLGFPVPVRVWLREKKYYEIVKESFLSKTAEKFFNKAELMKILNVHYKGRFDYSRKIWTIYVFILWYEMMFGD